MNPGRTQLTRIFFCANSRAAVLVNPTTPCLAALYADAPASATNQSVDAVLTMAPPPCLSISGISYFIAEPDGLNRYFHFDFLLQDTHSGI
jgi:hypothetical protein